MKMKSLLIGVFLILAGSTQAHASAQALFMSCEDVAENWDRIEYSTDYNGFDYGIIYIDGERTPVRYLSSCFPDEAA
jgi:photosystem II stability/assembly factor-like uncharacterized protein